MKTGRGFVLIFFLHLVEKVILSENERLMIDFLKVFFKKQPIYDGNFVKKIHYGIFPFQCSTYAFENKYGEHLSIVDERLTS